MATLRGKILMHKGERFILIFFVFVLLIKAPLIAEDRISIGVPDFDKNINWLKSKEVAAQIARNALTKSLVKLKENSYIQYSLDIADNMIVDSNFKNLDFRISRGKVFTNDARILPKDVLFSVNRCIKLGTLTNISSVSLIKLNENLHEGDWLRLSLKNNTPELASEIPLRLAECPIIEADSSKYFGHLLGQNSLLIGSGDFSIKSMKPGRFLELHRVAVQTVHRGPQLIEIRGFDEENRVLTALRLGTIDVAFVEDEEILKRAKEDETMLVSECFGKSIIKRKGLQFLCEDNIDFDAIGYIG